MSEKHAIYLEGLTKLAKIHPEGKDVLKCIAKCYILNEGLMDGIKSACGKAKEAVFGNPAKMEEPAPSAHRVTNRDLRLKEADRSTFDADFVDFKMKLNELLTYMTKFGDAALVEFLMSPQFKEAEEKGRYMDMLNRDSAMNESAENAMGFVEAMERLVAEEPSYGNIVTEAIKTYVVVETTYGNPVVSVIDGQWKGLTEMVHDQSWMNEFKVATDRLKAEVFPCIAKFIATHGYYSWDLFTRSNAFKLARQKAESMRKC